MAQLKDDLEKTTKKLNEKDQDIYKQELLSSKYDQMNEIITKSLDFLDKINIEKSPTWQGASKHDRWSLLGSGKKSFSPSPSKIKSNTP